MPAQTVIKLRRGTASQWTTANPVLAAGEVGIETDTNKFKFGNGTANWAALSYVSSGSSGGAVEWNDVLNKPTEFTPSSHTHSLSAVTDVTASASELNILDGATLTTTELNYVDGVTSAIQTQLNGKAASSHTHTMGEIFALPETLSGKAAFVHTHALTDVTDVTASASELNILDGATLTTTELNYVGGVTSAIQTQLNGKVDETNGAVTTASTSLNVVRNITLSTSAPSGGADGDVWLVYEA